jgi:hypothetical protein
MAASPGPRGDRSLEGIGGRAVLRNAPCAGVGPSRALRERRDTYITTFSAGRHFHRAGSAARRPHAGRPRRRPGAAPPAARAPLGRREGDRLRRRPRPVRSAPRVHGRGAAAPGAVPRGRARARGPLPRDRRRRRRLQARRVQPAPRGEDRARVSPHRVPAPRPRAGGEHGAHAGGEEVRPVEGREALVLRGLVDPRLHHPLHHGELADGEAGDHPGPAEALLQPRQGAREAAGARRTSRSRRRRSRR